MGPSTNQELFRTVEDSGAMLRLGDEVTRRLTVGGTLTDLSEAFDHGAEGRSGIIAEPVMVPKLMALAAIQRTHLGVAGFDPQIAIGIEDDSMRVRAFPAPSHDSFSREQDGAPVHTRAIKMDIRNGYTQSDDPSIEMYGLNLFIPDPDADTAFSEPDAAPKARILLVSEGAKVSTTADTTIAGETPFIAVRNKKTGDARVYMISVQNGSTTPDEFDTEQRLLRNRSSDPVVMGNVAWVERNGQTVRIEVVEGEQLQAVAREFEAACSTLRNVQGNVLSAEERLAVGGLATER